MEDDVWNTLVNKYANSKLCVDKLVYIYNNNNDSLMNHRSSSEEFQNLIYRFEMYKRIFSKKEEEKLLIFQYYFLFYRFKNDLKHLLLINNNSIIIQFKRIFKFFIDNYNCSIERRNEINSFLNTITTNSKQ